jgi:hypothetical protein
VYLTADFPATGEGSDERPFFDHYWPRTTSEDIVFLAPGKTYVDHTYWKTTKLGAGNYTLDLGSGIKAQFELRDCGREKVKE